VAVQGASHLVLGPPRAGFVEQVYAHELTADSSGLVRTRLVNDRLGLAFELEYDQSQFPSFFQWLHLREGGPGNTWLWRRICGMARRAVHVRQMPDLCHFVPA
jgi:hypothetical protein